MSKVDKATFLSITFGTFVIYVFTFLYLNTPELMEIEGKAFLSPTTDFLLFYSGVVLFFASSPVTRETLLSQYAVAPFFRTSRASDFTHKSPTLTRVTSLLYRVAIQLLDKSINLNRTSNNLGRLSTNLLTSAFSYRSNWAPVILTTTGGHNLWYYFRDYFFKTVLPASPQPHVYVPVAMVGAGAILAVSVACGGPIMYPLLKTYLIPVVKVPLMHVFWGYHPAQSNYLHQQMTNQGRVTRKLHKEYQDLQDCANSQPSPQLKALADTMKEKFEEAFAEQMRVSANYWEHKASNPWRVEAKSSCDVWPDANTFRFLAECASTLDLRHGVLVTLASVTVLVFFRVAEAATRLLQLLSPSQWQ